MLTIAKSVRFCDHINKRITLVVSVVCTNNLCLFYQAESKATFCALLVSGRLTKSSSVTSLATLDNTDFCYQESRSLNSACITAPLCAKKGYYFHTCASTTRITTCFLISAAYTSSNNFQGASSYTRREDSRQQTSDLN